MCNKIPYTIKAAIAALKAMRERGRPEYRRYYCPKCRAWHLTSQRKIKVK